MGSHERLSNTSANRIVSLDGLRALSIGLVLLAHLSGTRFFPRWPLERVGGDIGDLGVRVFFVISGFLITGLLLEEHRLTGSISLPLFYLRRALRIFPAALAFIAAMATAAAIGWIAVPSADLAHALTYTINYHEHRSWYLGHLWSLAVEEQFYLLWPATLVLVGPGRGMAVTGFVLLAAPVSRALSWTVLHGHPLAVSRGFQNVADALAAGCLLAGTREWLAGQRLYRWFLSSPCFLLVPLGILVCNLLQPYTIGFALGGACMNICVAVLVDRCVTIPGDFLGRTLNSRVAVQIGVLSYSLYLWQQPFLNRKSAALICAFPVNIGLAFLVAGASYYLLEKPLMRLRRRLRRRVKPLPETVREMHASAP